MKDLWERIEEQSENSDAEKALLQLHEVSKIHTESILAINHTIRTIMQHLANDGK